MSEIISSDRALTVSVDGSEPVVLHLASGGDATLRLEITITGTDTTGYTFTEPPR